MKMTRKHQLLLLAALVTGATQATAATVTSTADVSNTLTFAPETDVEAKWNNADIRFAPGLPDRTPVGVVSVTTKSTGGIKLQMQYDTASGNHLGGTARGITGGCLKNTDGTYPIFGFMPTNGGKHLFPILNNTIGGAAQCVNGWTEMGVISSTKPVNVDFKFSPGNFPAIPGHWTLRINARGYTD